VLVEAARVEGPRALHRTAEELLARLDDAFADLRKRK